MPSTVSARQAHAYRHASDLPKDVWRMLLQVEGPANVILPFAKKALNLPRDSDSEQLWIALYDDTNNVEFVLSCTKGPLGDYPIFIVASKSPAEIAHEEKCGKSLADTLLPLVLCLLREVPPERVFSVFSVAKVAKTFAGVFEAEARARQYHGIRALKQPYYDATFTFCTNKTLENLSDSISAPEGVTIALRSADISHLKGIKAMCKAFSETSPPFVLDDAGAESEARMLIENRQAWVYVVQRAGHEPEIACLIATTRESDNVTAVTKVFTAVQWRGRGCAARLLHRVCQEILQGKKRVVLYVGNSNELAPARKVYHKVGFQGLDGPQGQQVKDVERWLEIGFKGTTLGYW